MKTRMPGSTVPSRFSRAQRWWPVPVVILGLLVPADAHGQEPPDSLRADSLRVDSLVVDTAQAVTDTLEVEVTPDSLIFHNMPELGGGTPAGWERGVWVWERADLVAVRALTLAELVAEVPGVVPLRGGDYGTPAGVSAFGMGGGRLRVFQDGFEFVPLDGGNPDLSRIGLGGLEQVRIERGPAELRVELSSLRFTDPRPMSMVEAGTGDLDTNQFRGTFAHPRALGGALSLDMERVDTRGPQAQERGAVSGGWLRYTRHWGDDVGLSFQLRSTKAETDVSLYPTTVSRRDWIVQGRARLSDDVVAEVFTGSSRMEGPDDGLTPIDESRGQHGLRVGFERGSAWARASYRLLSGPEVPSSALIVEGGGSLSGVGGATARLSRESWEKETASLTSVTAWTEPRWGLSAFATWEDGRRGSRLFDPRVAIPTPDTTGGGEAPEPAGPGHRLVDRRGVRLGVAAEVGPLYASMAKLSFESDSLLILGLHTDRSGQAVEGGTFEGWELMTRLELPVEGFALYGSLQKWDTPTRYLPELIYSAGVRYHDLPMESDNLELWGSLGVEGRDPMALPFPQAEGDPPSLQEAPFAQSWHAYIQVRIVTLSIFLRFENLSVRRNNQDYPERILPATRSMYGIRWTLWN